MSTYVVRDENGIAKAALTQACVGCILEKAVGTWTGERGKSKFRFEEDATYHVHANEYMITVYIWKGDTISLHQ